MENMSQIVKSAKEVSIYKVLKEISGKHPLEITPSGVSVQSLNFLLMFTV